MWRLGIIHKEMNLNKKNITLKFMLKGKGELIIYYDITPIWQLTLDAQPMLF